VIAVITVRWVATGKWSVATAAVTTATIIARWDAIGEDETMTVIAVTVTGIAEICIMTAEATTTRTEDGGA